MGAGCTARVEMWIRWFGRSLQRTFPAFHQPFLFHFLMYPRLLRLPALPLALQDVILIARSTMIFSELRAKLR